MGPQNVEPDTAQDTLSSYLDNSAASVRQTFVRFEKAYVVPIFDLLRALFLAYPIPFVFFSIFGTLGFFPVLAFAVVSIATLSAALTLALCLAFAFSTGVFLLLGSILLTTLGFALLLSAFLTASSTSAYLFGRLVLLLYTSGRDGFRIWSQEVSRVFLPSSAHLSPVDDARYASEDSDILVGQCVKDEHTTKMEPVSHEPPDSELKSTT